MTLLRLLLLDFASLLDKGDRCGRSPPLVSASLANSSLERPSLKSLELRGDPDGEANLRPMISDKQGEEVLDLRGR